MTKLDRLHEAYNYLRFKGIVQTYTDVASKIGSTLPNVSAAMKGNKRNLTDNFLKRFAKSFGIDEAWLLTGEGEMLKGDNARLVGEVYAAQAGDAAVSGVPFVPVAAHASFIESLEQPSAGLDPDLYPVVLTPAEKAELGKYRVFEVEGESMHPSLRNGSLILAKEVPEASWHYAEGVVVVVTPEMVVVKRVLRNDLLASNSLLLGSDNELYGSYPVPLSDIRAIFKARRIISSDL